MTTPDNNVVVLHAYSATNTGDGLLVDLTTELIKDAIPSASIKIVALDPDSFESPTIGIGSGPAILSPRARTIVTALTGLPTPAKSALKGADLIVAVGGGYLRGGRLVETLKTVGAHGRQLVAAGTAPAPSIYLPQSIGPFSKRTHFLATLLLRRLDRVYVRDDLTLKQFRGTSNMRRMPDLAVLSMARGKNKPLPLGDDRPIFVARDLDNPRTYHRLLEDCRDNFEWAIQATGGGNNDIRITRAYSGIIKSPLLSELLAERRRSRVVVSTRLHGSMAALLAGYPSIHLSYERKGWGAFEDLGLGQYVINARDARAGQVRELIKNLSENQGEYWGKIDENIPALEQQRTELVSVIRQLGSR